MKHLTLIVFLVFISCKNESKTGSESESEALTEKQAEVGNGIDKSASKMWNNFIRANPKFKDEDIPESDFFHNNREDANRLAKLTLIGKKKASSGLYSLYKLYNVDLPSIGAKQIVTDFDGKAMAIIENVSVDTIPFNKVSEDYAKLDMAIDINSLEQWKKAHWDFFESFLKENGKTPTQDMLIVCTRFKKIWPKN